MLSDVFHIIKGILCIQCLAPVRVRGGGGTASDLLSSLRVGCWGLGVGAGFLVVVLVLVVVPPPLLLAQYVFLNNDGLGRDPPGSKVFFGFEKKNWRKYQIATLDGCKGKLRGSAPS